jgi:hypothetical protein
MAQKIDHIYIFIIIIFYHRLYRAHQCFDIFLELMFIYLQYTIYMFSTAAVWNVDIFDHLLKRRNP